MIDWYGFLDPRFAPNKANIKVRDRYPTVCSKCGYVSITQIQNLKLQLKRLGIHLCWSCSASNGAKRRWNKKRELKSPP